MATKIYETRHGPMMAFTGDQFMTPTLEKAGEYAPQEWALLEQLTRPGMTVVEVGTNIGVHSIPLAKRCFPGPIFLFEPQQRVFQVLCANLALNNITNAFAYPEACGAADGEAVVPSLDYDAVQNFGGVSLMAADAPGEKVRVVALDSLNLPVLGLLKIDVEGFEPQVLKGARETIARCRPVIYIENDRPQQQGEVIRLIADMGYSMYWHTPMLADPSVFGGKRFLSVNMGCFPLEAEADVKGAERIDPDNWTSPIPAERL
jgi:FkbM family methyltransferase